MSVTKFGPPVTGYPVKIVAMDRPFTRNFNFVVWKLSRKRAIKRKNADINSTLILLVRGFHFKPVISWPRRHPLII